MSDINVLDHIGFVKSYVFKITKDKELRRDLIQVGMLGLVEAKDRYKENRNNTGKFLSYGASFSLGRIKDYIKDTRIKHDRTIYVYKERQDTGADFANLDNPSISICNRTDANDPFLYIDDIEYNIEKERVLLKVLEFLDNYINKDKIKAFTCIYLDNGNGIDILAKEHGVSKWTIRQRASLVKKDLIKHINGE